MSPKPNKKIVIRSRTIPLAIKVQQQENQKVKTHSIRLGRVDQAAVSEHEQSDWVELVL